MIHQESTSTTNRDGNAFAVWITGLPASGKSTLARALVKELAVLRVNAVILESDELRKILTPTPDYSAQERDFFYSALTGLAALLVSQGFPVIIDATANRSLYREEARQTISRFLEVLVDTPLEVCIDRDPKGIYGRARQGLADTVPGLQIPYENGSRADLIVSGTEESPSDAALRIIAGLRERNYLPEPPRSGAHRGRLLPEEEDLT